MSLSSTAAPTAVPTRNVELELPAGAGGERLDRFLASRLPDMSRARLQALLRAGNLEEGGQAAADPSRRGGPRERYRLVVPPPRPADPAPEERELRVLYEDSHLIVLVKPAGVVVHPAPGHSGGTLV